MLRGICSGCDQCLCTVTEARAAAKLARELGVAEERIVLEERASNTLENALFVKPLVLERGITELIVVTSDFHMKRSSFIFDEVFSQTRVKLTYVEAPSNYGPPERLARAMKEEAGLLQAQVSLGWPILGSASA
eukprot:SM000232S07937  [mRNA]  locus=s232:165890:167003:+ [translate_table: standard]